MVRHPGGDDLTVRKVNQELIRLNIGYKRKKEPF